MLANIRWPLAVVALVLIAALSAPLARTLRYGAEDISFMLRPTATHAYDIAERHFKSTTSDDYDYQRASMFFRIAYAKDPTLPFINHELARVEFLKGNYDLALRYIDTQISLSHASYPNSFYIRGLIEGYMGRYDEAAADYNHFLQAAPTNWAAMNDYAWVLIKGEHYQSAADITEEGLRLDPGNPWLLNSRATALYELGRYNEAYSLIQKADIQLRTVTREDWLTAYPGNDPAIADDGLTAFRFAIEKNMHMMATRAATSTIE